MRDAERGVEREIPGQRFNDISVESLARNRDGISAPDREHVCMRLLPVGRPIRDTLRLISRITGAIRVLHNHVNRLR